MLGSLARSLAQEGPSIPPALSRSPDVRHLPSNPSGQCKVNPSIVSPIRSDPSSQSVCTELCMNQRLLWLVIFLNFYDTFLLLGVSCSVILEQIFHLLVVFLVN